ncbi:retrovirus-related pol polyprotein from transposon TNT 1-94 [Tanacetum coccineum]
MTRSSTMEQITPFENPERVFCLKRRLFETPGLVESSSLEIDLLSNIEENSEEEETTEIMTETMEQYMSKTRQFLRELRENTFSGLEHEDANEHIKKVLETVDLFHTPEEVILFYNGLDVATRQILDSKGAIPTKTDADAKVGCKLCKGPHYTKDCPLKEEGKTLKEAYYTQFGAPYQPGGQYRAAGPGFYQRNNINSSYPDRRQTLEESLTKFMAESAKRHEENSNIIKEIRASTDAAIRNQGASIKTLSGPYIVLDTQYSSLSSETIMFPSRLHGYCCDNWKEASEVKILEIYEHTLPQKEKDRGSFTIPCFIYIVCFDKSLVDLRASVSVMPFFTYSNLGLADLAHTRLTIELADRTIKHPRGIAEKVLVRIGKFIFPRDFVILDIPEDDDVPLILG